MAWNLSQGVARSGPCPRVYWTCARNERWSACGSRRRCGTSGVEGGVSGTSRTGLSLIGPEDSSAGEAGPGRQRNIPPPSESAARNVSGIKVEEEAGPRIDHCEACRGYLKTYEGMGQESLLLADWTSLHLDLLAHERGLKREATSLYDLGSLLTG